MPPAVISVEELSKRYRLGVIGSGRLRGDVQRWWERVRGRPDPTLRIGLADQTHRVGETIWALRDVSFKLHQGEALGIIGRNGAGKSTLLKILSQVTAPTLGQVKIRGRLASLLEVGTGFHPELTGRENIYLNGAILGMKKAEIARKFDEIVDFSGVGAFIDTPIKRYSSGMYVRLAFAVAAHLEPEILVIDEVLAVGDLEFRNRSMGKMKDVSQAGRAVLFVSHNLGQIRQLCADVIWLDNGEIHRSGPAEEVCTAYERANLGKAQLANPKTRRTSYEGTYEGPRIEQVELRSPNGTLVNRFTHGDSFDLVVTLSEKSRPIGRGYSALWLLNNEMGEQIAVGWSFPMDRVEFTDADRRIACRIGPLNIPVGTYSLRIILQIPHLDHFDDWHDAISFRVERCDPFNSGYDYSGIHKASVLIPHKWRSLEVGGRS